MYYGREKDLAKFHAEMNDYSLPKWRRYKADRVVQTIWSQLKDPKLMAMRERLLRAGAAGDRLEIAKITAQMRDYTKEDRETGEYEV